MSKSNKWNTTIPGQASGVRILLCYILCKDLRLPMGSAHTIEEQSKSLSHKKCQVMYTQRARRDWDGMRYSENEPAGQDGTSTSVHWPCSSVSNLSVHHVSLGSFEKHTSVDLIPRDLDFTGLWLRRVGMNLHCLHIARCSWPLKYILRNTPQFSDANFEIQEIIE